MDELIKIRDLSVKYNISARTLRYYEDIGLISSIRSENYAYRLYDNDAITRIEQILILRKLNVSIKDIQHIFNSPGTEIVLQVLNKKISAIDEDITVLNELREIVLEFIREIKMTDFSKDTDVKSLYQRAATIENEIINITYKSNTTPNNIERLFELSSRIKKNPEIRIIKVNSFKALYSGLDTIENIFGVFWEWQRKNSHLVKTILYGAPDFMGFEKVEREIKAFWLWAVEDGVTDADVLPYQLIDFEGGLYAAAIAIDEDNDDCVRVYNSVKKWLEDSGFELDEGSKRRVLGHMLNPDVEIKKALGYNQFDMYVPIKIRGK